MDAGREEAVINTEITLSEFPYLTKSEHPLEEKTIWNSFVLITSNILIPCRRQKSLQREQPGG